FLERRTSTEDGAAFEAALCRECGQHYLVGPKNLSRGKLAEASRDPTDPAFGATFFRPLDEGLVAGSDEDEDYAKQTFFLCVRCGELDRGEPGCRHGDNIRVIREESPKDEDRADQMLRCGACGYGAGGRDPVREVVHGTDGPNAVIATTLYR